jgi:hypothetical protein
MKFDRLHIFLPLVLLVASCDLWPRDNPLDPARCEPRCASDQICQEGTCVQIDAAPPDGGVDTSVDVPWSDVSVDDLVTADLATDTQPDAAMPTCVTGWRKGLTVGTAALNGVWGASATTRYAVGDAGTVLRYDGASWSKVASIPTTSDLHAVWGSGPGDVWAVGDKGVVIRYDGTSWKLKTPGTTETLNGIWGRKADDLYVVGHKGVVRHYDGSAWTAMNPPGVTDGIAAVWGSKTKLYVVGQQLHRHDGSAWQSFALSGVASAVWGISDSEVYIGGGTFMGKGQISRFDGAKVTFVSSPPLPVIDLRGSAANDIWAVGSTGSVTRFDGKTWNNEVSGVALDLRAVWAADGEMHAVGKQGTIVQHTLQWKPVDAKVTVGIKGIWGSGPNDLFLIGGSAVAHYDGASWSGQPLGSFTLQGIWGSGATDVFIVSQVAMNSGGEIFHYDATKKWTAMKKNARCLSAVWGSGPGDVFAVGNACAYPPHDKALHYDGKAWSSLESGLPAQTYLNAIWGTANNNVYAVGHSGAIHRYDGTSWKAMTSGTTQSLNGIWGSGPSDIWVVGAGGTVLRYDGKTWSDQKLNIPVTLYAIWGSGPKQIFATGTKGAIYRYDGTSWKPSPSGTDSILFSVWGSSDKEVYAGGSYGKLVRWCGP